MTSVERRSDDFVIDAALLADAFGLAQEEIRARMRAGTITSRCEAGVAEDAGRWRLTFHHDGRACRFIVDADGSILTRAMFPVRTGPQQAVAPGGEKGAASTQT